MDIKQLKDIIQSGGGKIVIVENEEPTMVVMSFDEYQQMRKAEREPIRQKAETVKERVFEPSPAVSESKQEMRGGLTIDDLPF